MEFDLDKQSSPYLTNEFKTALKEAYRNGASLGSTEKEAVNLLETIISTALSFKTSDVHLHNFGEMRSLLRFRIDGILKPVIELPPNITDGLLSRLKYITNMKLDSPLPQDGRFATTYQDKGVVIRVSVMPTRLGEDAVLRLLAEIVSPERLEDLGLRGRNLEIIERELNRPYGMVLVCGPTSSGKTTALYTMLKQLDKERLNICTIEDPVEYALTGIRQLQVEHEVELDFSAGLRSILRHDPDVIFVGEIRDRETAEIAIDSALTGHLVFSSVHCNSAPEAISRMRDLGTRPYLLSATLDVIASRKLVRTICPDCKVASKPKPADAALIKDEYKIDVSKVKMYEGKGCDACQGYGYRGRVGIFDVIKISTTLRALVLASAPISKVIEQARAEGYTNLFEDGLEKVKEGLISLPDLLAATG
jgi:type II secretory ATPase GspE/PulE/Tfp pilus assembly ATPase PilB-like protein